jgi:hypothetical protein
VKKFVMGIILGMGLCLSLTTFAAPIKQFMLTQITYPFIVNGVEFKDEKQPVLNYNGSTYVPLAKLGDLTGVNYKWNESKKQVEISTEKKLATEETVIASDADKTSVLPGGDITLKPETETNSPKGLVQENGSIVLYAYDKEDVFKGTYSDNDSADLTIAKIESRLNLPPSISQGWLGVGELSEIYNNADISFEGSNLILKSNGFVTKKEEYFNISLPQDWKLSTDNNFNVGGIRIIDYRVNEGIDGEWVDKKTLVDKVDVHFYFCEVGAKTLNGLCAYVNDKLTGNIKKIYEALLPIEWNKSRDADVIDLNGIHIKKVNNEILLSVKDLVTAKAFDPSEFMHHSLYFNISDLQKIGLLK